MKSFVRISALLWADILVAYAFFEMQKYLTDVWKVSFTHAAGILNIWNGIAMILPLFFLFFVHAFLGHFMMLVLSSIAFTVGIGFVWMSTPPVLANATSTCKEYEPQCIGHTQKVLFYIGMWFIAVGMSGHLISVYTFIEEQKNQNGGEGDQSAEHTAPHGRPHPRTRVRRPAPRAQSAPTARMPFTLAYEQLHSYQIIGFFFVVLVALTGAIALPYIKPWSIRFGIPAICAVSATILFFSGWGKYIKKDHDGSPLTNVCRVFVASALKQTHQFPGDAGELYTRDGEGLRRFSRTRVLRCLERAAIIVPGIDRAEQEKKRWRLCTVAEVEEAKIAVRMVPMWLTFIICGIVSSIGNTYFIEQASKLNWKLGAWKVPLQIFLILFEIEKGVFSCIYAKMVNCFRPTSKKYAPPTGIAMAMIFSILCCIAAAKIEVRRLNVIRRHDLLDKPDEDIPMSVYWLLFQFLLLAGLDSFLENSITAFYDDQAPKSMKHYLGYFTKGISGLGFMCSVLSVHVVGKISEKGGKPNWFQHTLNRSRLDRYYWVLASLSSANLVIFVLVAFCYRYEDSESNAETGDGETSALPDTGNALGECCGCCG